MGTWAILTHTITGQQSYKLTRWWTPHTFIQDYNTKETENERERGTYLTANRMSHFALDSHKPSGYIGLHKMYRKIDTTSEGHKRSLKHMQWEGKKITMYRCVGQWRPHHSFSHYGALESLWTGKTTWMDALCFRPERINVLFHLWLHLYAQIWLILSKTKLCDDWILSSTIHNTRMLWHDRIINDSKIISRFTRLHGVNISGSKGLPFHHLQEHSHKTGLNVLTNVTLMNQVN